MQHVGIIGVVAGIMVLACTDDVLMSSIEVDGSGPGKGKLGGLVAVGHGCGRAKQISPTQMVPLQKLVPSLSLVVCLTGLTVDKGR